MKFGNQLALAICLAFAANVSLVAPSSAGLGADSARINALGSAGKYSEAIPLAEAMLANMEKGPPSKDLAGALNNLAQLYGEVGRDAEAEPLFKRALALSERSLPTNHPDIVRALNNLATNYEKQDRHAESEALTRRALALYEKVAPESPTVATLLNNLGQIVKADGRHNDAEPVIKRSLAIREKVLGRDHIDVARSLNNLADLYQREKRFADAEPLFQRALSIRERTVGPDHPDTVTSVNNLASLEQAEGRTADALALVERTIVAGRTQAGTALAVLFDAEQKHLMPADRALDEALDVAQRGSQSAAASAVNKLAVRLAAGSDRLAELVRRDQDLASEADRLDKAVIAAFSKAGSNHDEPRDRARLAAIAVERVSLQKTLAVEFPDYAALSNPLPLKAKEIQALLTGDEAFVLFSLGESGSFVFALTRDKVDWKRIALGTGALSQKVASFRRGLNVGKADDASGKSGLFDLTLANELYVALLGPVEGLVKDKRSLLVAPSGALTALPFHLLVTEKPAAAIPDKIAGYRDAAWLLKRQAVSVLPSVSSLEALRAFARNDQAIKPTTGFGDPVFNPSGAGAETRTASRSLANEAYADFWQGVGVDRAMLADALPQLPDTADELKAVAKDLSVAASDVHLGSDASETTVKRAPLADYRIIYFATHGLVAGDIKGVAEPSLALSIPKQPSALDDGLLTASEVAQLKLNADWVVLSACNTIAGDKPGAEALSGLARSFFYAGARALLVTHWAVDSEAATRLTTSTFDLLKAEPGIGRAEALRRAMLTYLNDTSLPRNAYPALWGPFALIGEGRSQAD
jgi:CHAT domain-containing protein/Tfp pilus assembly protein PilF